MKIIENKASIIGGPAQTYFT